MRARVRHPLVLHTGAYWLMLTVRDAMAMRSFARCVRPTGPDSLQGGLATKNWETCYMISMSHLSPI